MEQWLNVQTLIWLFPIIFILHDFEEIVMIEKWMKNHTNIIYEKLPRKMANRVIKQFSMSTAQFSVSVLVIFLFVSFSTYMASQYVNHHSLANIHFFTVSIMVFFLHIFTHIGQSILFRSITPGVITSIFIVFPYCIVLFNSLMTNRIISWNTIFASLPYVILIIPIVLIAHWIGKKAV
ncbi:HXXEE domain-containing protein [Bacillus sp. FJAT-49732]|uniref:HXXEE domain-containing protein n=1 Tax=Lederbergia citrisecunda TaxID=2833583 RepID=A0A942TND8_9BACI|nr:HXXEE domain-containing protein [Lederbergia citrisecunda]MBS4200513.1 HXXEE domain-containing protein [Lederbergia citrisecunda]